MEQRPNDPKCDGWLVGRNPPEGARERQLHLGVTVPICPIAKECGRYLRPSDPETQQWASYPGGPDCPGRERI